MWHGSLLIALLAVVASFADGRPPAFAATAYDCVSNSRTAEACTSHPPAAVSIDVVKPTLNRTVARAKMSGERIARSNGLLIAPLEWQSTLECKTADLHKDYDLSGHAGRAPPTI